MCSVCNGSSCWVLASTLLQALACMVFICFLMVTVLFWTADDLLLLHITKREAQRHIRQEGEAPL
jgi:hypothetical protein